MEHKNWKCPKCGHEVFITDQFSATGGWFTKLIDVQSKKFTTLTCTYCKYTEMYKGKTSELANILDYFT